MLRGVFVFKLLSVLLPLIRILLLINSLLLIAGLIQPWWVLWWMSVQNRLFVLKYYGWSWLILLVFYVILLMS